MVEKRLRKFLLMTSEPNGERWRGWSSNKLNEFSEDQRRFLLEYKPFVDFVCGGKKIYIDTYWNPSEESLVGLESDECCIVLSDGMVGISCRNLEIKVLVEGFVRDWVLRFGETWKRGYTHFPTLDFAHLLRVESFEDDGRKFSVKQHTILHVSFRAFQKEVIVFDEDEIENIKLEMVV